jgi:hypothetical protein
MFSLAKVHLTMVDIINCIIINDASTFMTNRLNYLAYKYPNIG